MSAAQQNLISSTAFFAQMDTLIRDFQAKKPNMRFEEFVEEKLKGKMSEGMRSMLRATAPELDIS
jgi:hypothetical protein